MVYVTSNQLLCCESQVCCDSAAVNGYRKACDGFLIWSDKREGQCCGDPDG